MSLAMCQDVRSSDLVMHDIAVNSTKTELDYYSKREVLRRVL